jgi:hypothetical protein
MRAMRFPSRQCHHPGKRYLSRKRHRSGSPIVRHNLTVATAGVLGLTLFGAQPTQAESNQDGALRTSDQASASAREAVRVLVFHPDRQL